MLVNSFVVSRLDFCNALLAGASKSTLKLQYVQNSAARILTGTKIGSVRIFALAPGQV